MRLEIEGLGWVWEEGARVCRSFEHWESWCEGLLQFGEGNWVGHVCWDGEVSRCQELMAKESMELRKDGGDGGGRLRSNELRSFVILSMVLV
jgi:hypothetical protein